MPRQARYTAQDDALTAPRPEFIPPQAQQRCRCGRRMLVAEALEYGGRCETCWAATFKGGARTDGLSVSVVEMRR